MPRDGKPTRDKILKHSKDLVLERGFSGMSIDMIIQRSSISKGTFLYHFKTKNDLATSLMDEYIQQDEKERVKALKHVEGIKDPLERLLAFIQVFIDAFEKLDAPFPGCLYASYSYEPVLFDQEIMKGITDAFHRWEHTIDGMIIEIEQQYDSVIPIDKKALALHFTAIFEGAFIMSKALNDAKVTANQLKQYQNYIKLLFKKPNPQSKA
ncbi:MAG: TetR/AcrR family transcriptional regulator [Flagellimonas sp.]